MDIQRELVEEIAKAAASQVVIDQAPSRKEEHNGVATRIIKFILLLTILEIVGYSLVTRYLYSEQSDRITCNSSTMDYLQYEHIGKDNFKPQPSCR